MLVVRRIWVLLAVATALVLALLVVPWVTSGASGADAERCARFELQSRARERIVTGQGDRIVVIGDSYAVGLGLRKPRLSWPSALPGQVNVFAFSGSGFGARASDCPAVSYAARAGRALRQGADQVVVEGGLNDHDRPTREVRAGFRALMARLGDVPILVVGPPAAPDRVGAAHRVDALLRDESARAGVDYLSMTGEDLEYLDDGLHLTPAGHRAFGEVVATALRH